MNPTHAARLRLKRLLSGDFRTEDLTQLFLYARDRCQGRESVQEVGDFVAHHDERDRGPVTRAGKDFFLMVRFTMLAAAKQFDAQKLPPNLPEVLHAVMRAIDHKTIKRDVGIGKSDALKLLPGLIQKFQTNADGTLQLPNNLSDQERALVGVLTSIMIVRPSFTGSKVYEDFKDTLRARNVLLKNEIKDFEKLRAAIILYAVAAMHRCTLNVSDGAVAQLEASPNIDGGKISVSATSLLGPNSGPVSFTIFSTDLIASQHSDLRLIQLANWSQVELEVTPKKLLGILG